MRLLRVLDLKGRRRSTKKIQYKQSVMQLVASLEDYMADKFGPACAQILGLWTIRLEHEDKRNWKGNSVYDLVK